MEYKTQGHDHLYSLKMPQTFETGQGCSLFLDNFQLDNYFLPVKISPCSLSWLESLFIFSIFTCICCEIGGDFNESNAKCSFWDEFLQTLSTTLRIILGPQNFAFFMLYNHNLYLFISKMSRIIGRKHLLFS